MTCSSAAASNGLRLGGVCGLVGRLGRVSGLGRSLDLLLDLGLDDRLLRGVDLEVGLRLGGANRRDGVRVALELAPVAGQLEQSGDLLGRLRADAQPVLRTFGVDLDERGLLGGVVLADLFDDTAIALGARVGDDDAVVRRTDLAQALETDLDSHDSPECVEVDELVAWSVGCTPGGSSEGGPLRWIEGRAPGPTTHSPISWDAPRTPRSLLYDSVCFERA